ncbi:glycosyltransferase [Bacillus sp. FJAT-49711]|uniref:glycosyltransferase family 2 protein n=1 Tax=Bacillus sp. FJAT-49711 TaxID=2833585 RepID=UPI001BCA50EA|nr:glycosyltransferase [Bacillus sp. FJAT-49711]
MDKPLISLITVSYNSEKTIKDTIESVFNQTYKNIEYIIVDGLSNDNTVSIAKNYEKRFAERGSAYKILSEKDKGLYDAMNKGINQAQGKIIGILNSDDIYINNLVIEKVVNKMVSENADCFYADLLFVDENNTNRIVRKWKSGKGDFRFGWNPPHPTTFITKATYQKFGLYKVEYKISSDYDILYKIIHKGKTKTVYLPEYIVKMRSGGRSTSGLKSNIIASKEIYQTLKENTQKYKLPIILIRLFVKLKQFV